MFKWNERFTAQTCIERWWSCHDDTVRPYASLLMVQNMFMRELMYGDDMTLYYYGTVRNLSYWTWVSYV